MIINKKKVFILIQIISISRALAGLLFVCVALRKELLLFSSTLYVLACLSDAVDGYLARKYSCTSTPGQILDLFGDKFLTTASVLYAIARDMPIIPLSIILFREVFLLSLRNLKTNTTVIFKPLRILGGITVIPIWITTVLFLQYPEYIHLNYSVFFIIYWILGVLAFVNLSYRLIYYWKPLIEIFKEKM
jgi:phosphatidylglycerophosphate synthase